MKKEDLITKWLDYNLDEKELEAFKKLDADGSFRKLQEALPYFKAPEYSKPFHFQTETSKTNDTPWPSWKKVVSGIAAMLVISLGLYFFVFQNTPEKIIAAHGETQEVVLPDTSDVSLNAGSQLSYSKNHWEGNREVSLSGEAFFKVAKGKTFRVKTEQGTVEVLGTQFNVKSRNDYFEVTCYEGKVMVLTEDTKVTLAAGNKLSLVDGQYSQNEVDALVPTWLEHRSIFESIPYEQVIQEMERQYAVDITFDPNLSHTLFTGSFTHKNLESALQAITLPLDLSYEISGTNVTLKLSK